MGNYVKTGGSKAIIKDNRPVVCFLGIENTHKAHVELPALFEVSDKASDEVIAAADKVSSERNCRASCAYSN